MPLDLRCSLPRDHSGGHVYVDTVAKADEFRVTSCFVPMIPLGPKFVPVLTKMAQDGLTLYELTRDRKALEDARLAIGVLWGLTDEEAA